MTTYGFRRNTHTPEGEYRGKTDAGVREMEIHPDAGFLIHMLDSRRPMSRNDLLCAVLEYDGDYPDTAPACAELDRNLVALLECGMAVCEPLSSDLSSHLSFSAEMAEWISRQGVCSEECYKEGSCVCGLDAITNRLSKANAA